MRTRSRAGNAAFGTRSAETNPADDLQCPVGDAWSRLRVDHKRNETRRIVARSNVVTRAAKLIARVIGKHRANP